MMDPRGRSESPSFPPARDTILIMRNGLSAEDLSLITTSLEEQEYRYALFDRAEHLPSALGEGRAKLLLVGADADALPRLLESLLTESASAPDVPLLLYYKEPLQEIPEDLLIHKIDDVLLAPLNPHDLKLRIQRLIKPLTSRYSEVEQTKLDLLSHFGMRRFIGCSPAMLATLERIPRIATCDAAALLTGDTGTGKEMCARAIHYLGPRANNPFIPVNCGSIPHDLFENEMFGHEAGAFTDARQSRRGLVAEAEGGTLFLDEVDSLPLLAQVKLLRYLQDRQYRPLGAAGYRQSNTRVLAASNQNLQDKVREGRFREDLYYRLKVVSLWLPPLRDRREDILPLAAHFLETAAREYCRPVTKFSYDAEQKLLSYNWPGNVRELENIIRQAVVFADKPVLRASELQLPTDFRNPKPVGREPFKQAKVRIIEEFERTYLNEVVAACGGNISRAAREAKKDRRSFFALLKKYDLTSNSAQQLR